MERNKDACYSPDCLGKVVTALGAPSPDYDLYTVINTIVEGIVNDRVLVTEDSATVLLEGNGTSSSPLIASFAPDAITSSDGTVTVVQEADGTFDLSSTAPVADLNSPDNSIVIIPPVNPGDPTGIELATTFTGSPSIDVTYAPGAPPDYSFALSPTALISSPNPALTPVSTVFSGGQFQLGVALGIIPRTVIVGGQIGSTPNSPTLGGALALLPPAITVDAPWTLLFLPGTYDDVPVANIPPNVNLIAMMRGSVRIESDIVLQEPALAASAAIFVDGITFLGGFIVETTANVGVTFQGTVAHCTFALGTDPAAVTSINSQPATTLGWLFENCTFSTTTRTLRVGGAVALRSCSLTCLLDVDDANTRLQIVDSTIDSSGVTLNNLTSTKTVSAFSSILGGPWTGSTTLFQNVIFSSCRALASWTFNFPCLYQDSYVRDTVTQVSPTNYTITSTPFSAAVAANRPIKAAIAGIAVSAAPTTVSFALSPPLSSSFSTSVLQVSSNAEELAIASATASSITLRLTGGLLPVATVWIDIKPPTL